MRNIANFTSHLLYACIWINPTFYKKSVERYNYDPVNFVEIPVASSVVSAKDTPSIKST